MCIRDRGTVVHQHISRDICWCIWQNFPNRWNGDICWCHHEIQSIFKIYDWETPKIKQSCSFLSSYLISGVPNCSETHRRVTQWFVQFLWGYFIVKVTFSSEKSWHRWRYMLVPKTKISLKTSMEIYAGGDICWCTTVRVWNAYSRISRGKKSSRFLQNHQFEHFWQQPL